MMKLWTNKLLGILWVAGAVAVVIVLWIARLRLDHFIVQSI